MKTLVQAENEARGIVHKWAVGATAVSWVPFSSMILSGADTVMIAGVAAAFEVQGFSVEKVAAAAAASVSGRWLAEGLSFVPGFGWIAKAVIAGGITKTMGEFVIAYFRERSPLEQSERGSFIRVDSLKCVGCGASQEAWRDMETKKCGRCGQQW